MPKRISILTWTVEADDEATRVAHAAMAAGDPERCGCQGCRNFIASRDQAYPPEARILLAQLGISVDRESQVGGAIPLADNTYLYSGFFHFVGSIVEGPDPLMKIGDIVASGPVEGGVVHSLRYEPLVGAFAVALTNQRHLLPEQFPDRPVVQFEFTTQVPWCLPEPPE